MSSSARSEENETHLSDYLPRPALLDAETLAKMTPQEVFKHHQSRTCTLFGGEEHGQGPDPVPDERSIRTAEGLDIATFIWMPPKDVELKGAIMFFHGYLHYGHDRPYARQAAIWNKLGYACGAIDYEGHGKSGGTKGLVSSMEGVVGSVLQFVNDVFRPRLRKRARAEAKGKTSRTKERTSSSGRSRSRSRRRSRGGEAPPAEAPTGEESEAAGGRAAGGADDVPLFFNGESLGGCVLLLSSLKLSPPPAGLIVFAPMVGIAADMIPSECMQCLLKVAMALFPAAPIVPAPDHLERCFADATTMPLVRSDPIRYKGNNRLKTAFELFNSTVWLQEHLAAIKTPFIVFHGEDDMVTDPAMSAKLFDEASSKDKTHVVLEGARHVASVEPLDTRRRYCAMMTRWVVARTEGASHDSVGPIGGARSASIPKGTAGYFWPTAADVRRTRAMGGGYWDEDEEGQVGGKDAGQARGGASVSGSEGASAGAGEGHGEEAGLLRARKGGPKAT